MAVRSESYSTVKDREALFVPALAYRDIKKVSRSGTVHDIILTGTVGNRQVLYTAAEGKFTFNTPFTSIDIDMGFFDIRVSEKIFIIWDE